MGSSGSGAVDCSVGSIVWVRRRNGSWWPGKILSPEELAASHLTSPRSGTPVKLLGREDASVDWYNLEKSKRVKAFRCGEFDDCIERAESSQGMPIRKREKYARREDAILHALELEKEVLRKQGKFIPERIRSKSGSAKKELATSSGSLDINNGKPGNSKSIHFLKRQDTSCKDENIGSPLYLQKVKDGNQPNWEDDHFEVVPRMRGLQDFGLRTAPPKRKLVSSGASDGVLKPIADSNSQASSSGDLSMGRTSHANGGEQAGDTFRAKRSRSVYMPANSSDAMDYKEIPPNQAEMLPSQFGEGDFHPHPHSIIGENARELMEDVESDSSESDYSESDSDSSETEVDMDEEIVALSGAAGPTEAELTALERHGALEDESTSSEEHDESSLSGDMSHLYHHDPISANEAVYKWQLKGKRNTRYLTRRSVDTTDGRNYTGYTYGTVHEEKGTAFSQRSLGQSLSFRENDDISDGIDEADVSERDFGIQLVGLGNEGYMRTSRAASRNRNSFGYNMVDWGDMAWEDRTAMKKHWEVKDGRLDPMFIGRRHVGGRKRSMLIDVDLKVQASYQKEPVPIVSLMSKLNGKAIIGHPIQIEAIADGSSGNLLSTSDYFGNEIIYRDGNTPLPPAWRTARRTNSRVRRPHLSSALEGYEAAEDHCFKDKERKPSFEKLNVGGFGHKASLVRKSTPHIPQPVTDMKFRKRVPKKASSNFQKIRTLLSIGIEQNHGMKPIHHSSNCQMDGLIKPESSGPPTVACIPVKLVFSRLLEKINRPPSKAASKVVLSNSDAGRDRS